MNSSSVQSTGTDSLAPGGERHVDKLLAALVIQQADLVAALRESEARREAQSLAFSRLIDDLSAQVASLRSEVSACKQHARIDEFPGSVVQSIDVKTAVADALKESQEAEDRAVQSLLLSDEEATDEAGTDMPRTRSPLVGKSWRLRADVAPGCAQSNSTTRAPPQGPRLPPLSENTRLLRALLLRPIVDQGLRSDVAGLAVALASLEQRLVGPGGESRAASVGALCASHEPFGAASSAGVALPTLSDSSISVSGPSAGHAAAVGPTDTPKSPIRVLQSCASPSPSCSHGRVAFSDCPAECDAVPRDGSGACEGSPGSGAALDRFLGHGASEGGTGGSTGGSVG
jgi:hypothetical protein